MLKVDIDVSEEDVAGVVASDGIVVTTLTVGDVLDTGVVDGDDDDVNVERLIVTIPHSIYHLLICYPCVFI